MENPIKMYDLGVPLFLETPTWMNPDITIKQQNLGMAEYLQFGEAPSANWLHIF